MTKQELRKRYPECNVIKSNPSPECPVCLGEGEHLNPFGKMHPCTCVCLSGNSEGRAKMTEFFQDWLEELIKKASTGGETT